MRGAVDTTILIVSARSPEPDLNLEFLRQPNIAVLTSLDDDEALGVARRESPNLIIDEAEPSDADAMALCRRLREDPRTRAIPVILVANPDVPADASGDGPDVLLRRPLIPREFFENVRRFVPLPSRRHQRHRINLRFTFSHLGRTVPAFSRDLSLNGAFLKTDRRLATGTHLEISFRIPGDPDAVQCGAVVRTRLDDGAAGFRMPGLGLEFEDIHDGDLARLDELLARFTSRRRF